MSVERQYFDRINAIVGDDVTDGKVQLNLRWNNRDEAKAVLAKIRTIQTELRALKQEISADARALRSQYTTKRLAVGKSITAGLAGMAIGRRAVGMFNAARRDDLRREQLAALEPFERVKGVIDRVIQALNEGKRQVESSAEYRTISPKRAAVAPSVQTNAQQYFVRLGSTLKGPYSAAQIRGLLNAGNISLDTPIQIDGVDAWLPLRSIRVLQ